MTIPLSVLSFSILSSPSLMWLTVSNGAVFLSIMVLRLNWVHSPCITECYWCKEFFTIIIMLSDCFYVYSVIYYFIFRYRSMSE